MMLAPAVVVRRGTVSAAYHRHRLAGLLARAVAISILCIVPVAVLRNAITGVLDELSAGTHEDRAWSTAARLAYGVYPAWRELHPDARCPTVNALTPEALDPWGARYQIACIDRAGTGTAVVWSRGSDGLAGTDDDIWSDR